jgi:hypothetical protein
MLSVIMIKSVLLCVILQCRYDKYSGSVLWHNKLERFTLGKHFQYCLKMHASAATEANAIKLFVALIFAMS